jgi:hypothetical protein
VEDGFSDRNGQNGIIRKTAPGMEQGKILGLDRGVLVNRSDDVSCDGSDHGESPE